jgi:methionyl aminopeptidase
LITIKSPRELDLMRKSNQLVARVRDEVAKMVEPGVTTRDLDERAKELILAGGAKPSFLNYKLSADTIPFPGCICSSINSEVVHGMPSDRKLIEGDILSLDVGVELNGYCGDTAMTVPVGKVSREAEELMSVTRESLMRGIDKALGGAMLGDVSHAIQSFVEERGYSVVRDFVGHGIGTQMHEEPPVPHYGRAGTGPLLKPGMTIAIEPMVNVGTHKVAILTDGWTVVTADGELSAHFEHTIAIRDGKAEILTLSADGTKSD